jgi:MFS family permease
MGRVSKSLLLFSVAGLFGPLVWNVTRHPSRMENFTSDLVFLLWPTQPIGAVEVSVGGPVAAALTIGANLVLFALLGLAVGALARTRGRVVSAYILVCVLLFLWALFGAGFSFAHLGVFALVVALVLYAIPFWLVMRASAMPQTA